MKIGDTLMAEVTPMPILIMALLALGVFLVMGLMLFYAAYKEAHTPHSGQEQTSKTAVHS